MSAPQESPELARGAAPPARVRCPGCCRGRWRAGLSKGGPGRPWRGGKGDRDEFYTSFDWRIYCLRSGFGCGKEAWLPSRLSSKQVLRSLRPREPRPSGLSREQWRSLAWGRGGVQRGKGAHTPAGPSQLLRGAARLPSEPCRPRGARLLRGQALGSSPVQVLTDGRGERLQIEAVEIHAGVSRRGPRAAGGGGGGGAGQGSQNRQN